VEIKPSWILARIGRDSYRTELITDNHTIVADEPLGIGGGDAGPSPGDLLKMSIASCTAITLRMYADRKKLPVDQIEVKVYSETVNSTTTFHCNIGIEGNLNEETRQRLLQIANACPIHKLLTNPIEIVTKLQGRSA
jgi:putative redox protein